MLPMRGVRTNKQTTSEDRATQLVICGMLSLAIDCNSRANRITLYHIHYFYRVLGWSLVDLVLKDSLDSSTTSLNWAWGEFMVGETFDTVACTRIGEMRDRVKRYRRSSVLSEAAIRQRGKQDASRVRSFFKGKCPWKLFFVTDQPLILLLHWWENQDIIT